MCRLVLLNAAAAKLFSPEQLAVFFLELEESQGGHGNGIAALWPDDASIKIRKGLTLTAYDAARKLGTLVEQGAEWLLYHTRFATSGEITSRNCHPFQHGKLTLAHNGHDYELGHLGRSIGVTDSECLALLWARLRLPLEELLTAHGVFVGFFEGAPFVVKGDTYSDLLLAVQRDCGAVLFASELPQVFHGLFDQVIEVGGRLIWKGNKALEVATVPRRVRPAKRSWYSSWDVLPAAPSTPAVTSSKQTPLKCIPPEEPHERLVAQGVLDEPSSAECPTQASPSSPANLCE